MRYEAPETLNAAVKLLAGAKGVGKVLAGGTDLLVQMRSGMVEPDLIVDIKHIPETRKVTAEKGGFRVGAAVSGAELDENAKFAKAWPGVLEAFELIGSTQVQGRCTLVGNLCNASPAADSVPALIAAGAKASIVGPKGRREVPVEDIMVGPRKLSLTKGEIVASFLLPARPARTGDAYLRFIPRTEMDIAVVGCGVCLTLDAGGACTAARVSLGAVAPRPLLVAAAAAFAAETRRSRIGIPIGLHHELEFGAFGVTALLMGTLGTVQMASHQIALNIASLTFMVPLGVGAAAAVLVGRAVGRGDPIGARYAAGAALAVGVIFMGTSAILMLLIPARLASIYTDMEAVLGLAATLIPIAGAFQIFDGIQVVSAGALRGLGDTRVPMLIGLVGFWLIGLPVSVALGFGAGLGPIGLWWGLVAGLGAVALLLLARVRVRFSGTLIRVVIDDADAAFTPQG